MKITGLKATPAAVPYIDSERTPLISVIVEVYTDEGITGYGESPAILGGEITSQIIREASDIIIGEDAANINPLIRRMQIAYYGNRVHIQGVSWIFSGIELALWDINAKKAGMTLHELWGGTFRKQIEMMGIIEHDELPKMKEAAAELIREGYNTVYTKLGYSETEDIETVKAIRSGMPDRSKQICVEMGQAWPTGIAVNIIKAIQDQGIKWVEQPSMRYNLQNLRDVKNRVNAPILSHESGSTMYDALNVIKENAADYLKIEGRFDAGYNGARISAGIGEAGGTQCVYDNFDQLGVAMAGALNMMAAYPNFSLPWTWGDYGKLADDVITGGKFKINNIPYLDVPHGPGIGVTVDEERLSTYNDYYKKIKQDKGYEAGMGDPYRFGGMYGSYYRDYEA